MYRLNWQQVTDTLLIKWKQKKKRKTPASVHYKKGIVQYTHSPHTHTHTHTVIRILFLKDERTGHSFGFSISTRAVPHVLSCEWGQGAKCNGTSVRLTVPHVFNAYHTIPVATLHAHPHQTFKVAKQTITALKKKREKKKVDQRQRRGGLWPVSDLDENNNAAL